MTAHPYAEWAAQQLVEAVGFNTSIARLIRDRDRIYGARFDARGNHLGSRPERTFVSGAIVLPEEAKPD